MQTQYQISLNMGNKFEMNYIRSNALQQNLEFYKHFLFEIVQIDIKQHIIQCY